MPRCLFAFEPIGTIKKFAGNYLPDGYLDCDGSAVSRATYSTLYAALGGAASPFGQGDGINTFNVPDFRGRSPMGMGQGSGLTLRNRGDVVGAEIHLLDATQIPSHTHGLNFTSAGESSHTHSVGTFVNDGGSAHSHGAGLYVNDGGSAHSHGVGLYVNDGGSAHSHTMGDGNTHTHSGTTLGTSNTNVAHGHTASGIFVAYNQPGTGANVGYNDGNGVNNPRNFNVSVTVDNSGTINHSHPVTGSTDIGTSHSHLVSAGNSHSHIISGNSAAGNAHSHLISGNSAAGNNHSHIISGASASGANHAHGVVGTSDSGTGGGLSHNNMQPSLCVRFIIRY